ncbi:MAG: HPP family protein [Myxococcota bacterium]
MRVGDLMQQALVSVSPELSVEEFEELLTAERIGGAPVVADDQTGVLGVASKTDIVRALSEESTQWIRDLLRPDLTVRDIMTLDPVCVSPDEDVANVARTMIDGGLHRVLVIDKGDLVGIVTPLDLLAVIAAPP